MTVRLTDSEIGVLLCEQKNLPPDYASRFRTKPKSGHEEREMNLKGVNGSEFRIILRKSLFNVFDFSVILAYLVPRRTRLFRLRRYNGKSHEHTNEIEKETFYNFHIHTATERYQELGMREDSFAEATSRFSNFEEAIRCLISDCNLVPPHDAQGDLFDRK